MPRQDLEAIVSDPEFATFSAEERAKIVRDAQARTHKKPPLVTMAAQDPTPAQKSLNQQAAQRQARAIPPSLPQPVSPLKAMAGAAVDRFKEGGNLTIEAAKGAGMMLAAPTMKAFADNEARKAPPILKAAAASPAARKIQPNYFPAPSLSEQVVGAVDPIIEATKEVARDPKRLSPLAPGAGEGYAAAATDIAMNVIDPVGDAAMLTPLVGGALAVKGGAMLAGKALKGADLVAGDFAGRLAKAATPAIQAAAPHARRAMDAAAEVGEAVKDAATGNITGKRPAVAGGRLGGGDLTRFLKPGPMSEADELALLKAAGETNPRLQRYITELERDMSSSAPAPKAGEWAEATVPAAPALTTADKVQNIINLADAVQKSAPARSTAPGAREGSIRVGRQPSDGWTPAQQAANRAIERKVRELVAQRKQAELDGNHGLITEIDGHIQALDDARVVIPRPGQGPVTTIADLRTQHAAATAAGDTATANRLDRQIRRMRATNYYNDRKYGFMSPESVDKFESLMEQKVAELRAEGRDPRTPVPFATVRRQSQDILPFSLEQMARKGLKQGESLTAAEYEAAKNYMQQLVEESVTVERNLEALRRAPGTPPEQITIESARLMQLEKDVSGLLEIVTQSRSQKGRDLAYLKMVAQQGWDTDYWLARANRTAGGVATNAQISEISGIVVRGQQAEALGDAAGMRQARIDLAQAMGRLTVTPWVDALLAARKAGLLSGFKTIARNTTSNTINLGLEEMVTVIGVVPDAFLSMWTGRRTVFAREAANIGRAVNESLTRGVAEARETMLFGMPLDQLAALDVPSEVNTPSRALNTYVNTIMRFQGAQDRLFKAYALRRSLDSQARSLALEAANAPGPRPNRAVLDQHARHLADNPTEQMMMEAIADAEFATFQNETAISTAISRFKKGLREYDARTGNTTGTAIARGVDLIMPFTKTPAAIGARVLDFAVGTGTHQAARKRGVRIQQARAQQANPNRPQGQRGAPAPIEFMTREEQRAISKGFARQAIGATLIYWGQRWYEEGRLTGTDQLDRREENNAAGRIGNAIKMGDEWVPLNPFSPVGNLLTLGATMARDGQATGLDEAVTAATQVLTLMLDQPFTQGAKQFVEVAGDTQGRKRNRLLGSVAGSVVPSFMNEAAMLFDSSEDARAVDYSTPLSAIGQSVQARVPFAREGLPTRYTGLGDAQDANTGLRALAAGAGRFARENYDPVAREVLITGASLPRVEDDIQLERNSEPVPLSLAEQMEYQRLRGHGARQGVMAAVSNPAYLMELPDVQRDLLDRDIKGRAAQMKQQFLTPEMRALLQMRLEMATEAARAARGRGRAVVGPMNGQ